MVLIRSKPRYLTLDERAKLQIYKGATEILFRILTALGRDVDNRTKVARNHPRGFSWSVIQETGGVRRQLEFADAQQVKQVRLDLRGIPQTAP